MSGSFFIVWHELIILSIEGFRKKEKSIRKLEEEIKSKTGH